MHPTYASAGARRDSEGAGLAESRVAEWQSGDKSMRDERQRNRPLDGCDVWPIGDFGHVDALPTRACSLTLPSESRVKR
jgi:hypothetical protein